MNRRFFDRSVPGIELITLVMNWENLTDQELLIALNQGKQDAFDQIYRRYWRLLYDAAYRRVRDQEQAKDVVQDVFVALWDQRQSLTIERLRPYLITAVRYQIFNLVARNKVSERYFRCLERAEPLTSDADEALRLDELVGQYELRVSEMPNKRREIYRLRFDEGLSTQHIADRLHITQKTVQNQLIKAIHFLKSTLLAIVLLCR